MTRKFQLPDMRLSYAVLRDARLLPALLALVMSAAALSACAGSQKTDAVAATDTSAATETSAAFNASACKAAGGSPIRVGKAGTEVCAKPYADAGKTCRDKADCTGLCKREGNVAVGESVTGTCQKHDHDNFGCYAQVIDGKTADTICVD